MLTFFVKKHKILYGSDHTILLKFHQEVDFLHVPAIWFIWSKKLVYLFPIMLLKITIFVSMWNLSQFREKVIFCQYPLLKATVSSGWDWSGLPSLVQLLTWLQVSECRNF